MNCYFGTFPILNKVFPIFVLAFSLVIINACDSGSEPEQPISISITQPSDSQVVTGSVVRILTETSSQCGCNSHVEFFVDGVHMYSHYQPFYYYDWNIEGLSGEHVIRARLVVADNGESNDSIRVFIER